MRIRGITRRWIVNIMGVITVVLLAVAIVFSVLIQNYYYTSIRRTLASSGAGVTVFFSRYTGKTNAEFKMGAREFVENFTEKTRMEVWVIDSQEEVVSTSTGFPVNKTEMYDYYLAKQSATQQAQWVGSLESGEHVMAYTTFLPASSGQSVGPAVRYIVSLTLVDEQIRNIIVAIVISCFGVLMLVILSGLFFLRSIVAPVREISATTRLIAQGDFNARINKTYDDEIGALCDDINNMAQDLEDANNLKNDFISTVSHELRTPLTAIQGWGETLSEVGATDEQLLKKGMHVIISEAYRLSGIVEDLLDFSRMKSGRMNLRSGKLDLLAELDETVFAFRERAKREQIELVYNVPDVPAPAFGDADRLKQVFVNILDNAIKYSRPGGKVSVGAEIRERKVRIWCTDEGCGISAGDLPFVKEKFFKANKTVRGSGIGLAVSDEIVQMHNGILEVDSVENEGTTVTITLPAEVSPEDYLPIAPVELLPEIEGGSTEHNE